MSRSYRKTPISGITTAVSEKEDKRRCNRSWRRKIKQAIFHEREIMPIQREVMNVWSMNKDGKRWWGHMKNRGDTVRYHGKWCRYAVTVTTAEEWREMYDRMMRK